MLVKGRQHSGKAADHQHHLDTAEAAEMRRQDVVTINTEPPHLSNAMRTLFRTRGMLPNFLAGVEDDRVTRERPGEIKGEATGKMVATRTSVRNITMPSHNKT
jgi:hypothetical protein